MRGIRFDNDDLPPEELFAAFLAHARRSAIRFWGFQSLTRGFLAGACLAAAMLWQQDRLDVPMGMLAVWCGIVVILIMLANMWISRRYVTDYVETIDRDFEANGKIVGAAEFLVDAERDPFKRLAVSEAGVWLAARLHQARLNRWPLEIYALIPSIAIVYMAYRFSRAG